MKPMKPLSEVTPDEADAWWDDLDERTDRAEEIARARLENERSVSRLDLFTSGDDAKAVLYLETKADRLNAESANFGSRAQQIIAGSMFEAQLPFAAASVELDSVEEMKARGDDFSTPFR
jgi:hypothetical protein